MRFITLIVALGLLSACSNQIQVSAEQGNEGDECVTAVGKFVLPHCELGTTCIVDGDDAGDGTRPGQVGGTCELDGCLFTNKTVQCETDEMSTTDCTAMVWTCGSTVQ